MYALPHVLGVGLEVGDIGGPDEVVECSEVFVYVCVYRFRIALRVGNLVREMSSHDSRTIEVAAVADGLLSKYLWRGRLSRAVDESAFMSAVPERAFGVFATVKRGKDMAVHGCMGGWNPKRSSTPNQILARARKVLYSAIYEDPRRFKIPLWRDASALVEITFMVGPLEELSDSASLLPADQGILVEEDAGPIAPPTSHAKATATFLPGVFSERTPLDKIKRKLLDKAGIANETPHTFYTYTGKRIASTLKDLVMYSIAFTAGPAFVNNYMQFISKHTTTASTTASSAAAASTATSSAAHPPYLVDESGNVTSDGMQLVRNASVAADVLDAKGDELPIPTDWAESYIAHHFRDLTQDGAVLAQSVSFVAHHLPLVTPACHLMQRVLLSLDSTFALPEVLLGLHRTRCHMKTSTLPRAMNQLRIAIETMDVLRNPSACFALNWASQVAVLYDDKHLSRVVVDKWLEWIREVFNRHEARSFESNELVVVFEGLTHLIMGGRSRPEFVDTWMITLYAALCRIQPSTGLIAFTTRTARIDITGHLVRAIQHIRHMSTHSATGHHRHQHHQHHQQDESRVEVARMLMRTGR